MYYQAELVLKNYIPDSIETDMFFIIRDETGEPKYPINLWAFPSPMILDFPLEKIFDKLGYPVKLFIIDPIFNPMSYNVDNSRILATPEQIGWFDEGEEIDEYRDITLKDINLIFGEHEGRIEIEIDEKDDIVNVILEEGKVIIRAL